ncbi:MAG: hypothetical protein LBV04_00075 [Deferribacteraceae bacterium]|jgi:cell shape-determining protein MreD|nr:hypothetical protein [Deferribacteraceae bacterium]
MITQTHPLVHNEYLRRALILALLYIFTNVIALPISHFDYIVVYYLVILPDIRRESFLGYSLLFGLAYDLHYPTFLGVGVLLFMGLNFAKVSLYRRINMTKIYADILGKLGLLLLYTMLTMIFLGYVGLEYWQTVLHYFAINAIAFLSLSVILGGVHAFRRA